MPLASVAVCVRASRFAGVASKVSTWAALGSPW